MEADISNWTEPQRRFAEVKSKTERTSDGKASRARETMSKCLLQKEEEKNEFIAWALNRSEPVRVILARKGKILHIFKRKIQMKKGNDRKALAGMHLSK